MASGVIKNELKELNSRISLYGELMNQSLLTYIKSQTSDKNNSILVIPYQGNCTNIPDSSNGVCFVHTISNNHYSVALALTRGNKAYISAFYGSVTSITWVQI